METIHPAYWIVLGIYYFWILTVAGREGMVFSLFTLLILSLPFNSTLLVPALGMSLPSVLLILVALLSLINTGAFVRRLQTINLWRFFSLQVVCLFFIAVTPMFSALYNDAGGLRGLLIGAGWAVLFLLPLRLVHSWKRLRLVFLTLIISAGSIAVVSLLQQFELIPAIEATSLPHGVLGSLRPDTAELFGFSYVPQLFGFLAFAEFGIFSSITVAVIVSILWYNRANPRLTGLAIALLVPVVVLTAFMTQSRGVWITMTAMICFLFTAFMLEKFPVRGYQRAAVVSLGIAVVALFSLLQSETLIGLANTLVEIRPKSVSHRLMQHEMAFSLFLDNPLLGIGVRQFDIPLSSAFFRQDVHNVFVSQLVSTGLLGTVPFLALWISIIYTVFAFGRGGGVGREGSSYFFTARTLSRVSLLVLFLEGMVFPGYYNKTVAFFLGMINAYYALSLHPGRPLPEGVKTEYSGGSYP